MISSTQILEVIFFGSLLGPIIVIFIYPLVLSIISIFCIKRQFLTGEQQCSPKSISLISVVRNGEALIEDKITNTLGLPYPTQAFEMILASDGSNDQTEGKVKLYGDHRVLFFKNEIPMGKNYSLNEAVKKAKGDILVFSDADGILESQALEYLLEPFSNPLVGGVCGLRVIGEKNQNLESAQKGYIQFDSGIKNLESRIGSITSNDGKLYAIRRDLFQNIPDGVTDDLYTALSVIKQNYLFLFTKKAKVFIKTPSRNSIHEIKRRRRIVCRSLRGIWLQKVILNPFRFGFYSFAFGVNKILRRMMPLFCIVILGVSFILCFSGSPFFILFMGIEILFLGSAFLGALLDKVRLGGDRKLAPVSFLLKGLSFSYYFILGIYGTFLGTIDFILGVRYVVWEPVKKG